VCVEVDDRRDPSGVSNRRPAQDHLGHGAARTGEPPGDGKSDSVGSIRWMRPCEPLPMPAILIYYTKW
jgi:hypothetical protein